MSLRIRPVTVKQVPEMPRRKDRRVFLREFEESLNADRPRIVLDCSLLSQLDPPMLQLLLCCLEESMKRNGDLRLAMLPPNGMALLEQTGADRLFEAFGTVEEAAASFHRPMARIGAVTESETERQVA